MQLDLDCVPSEWNSGQEDFLVRIFYSATRWSYVIIVSVILSFILLFRLCAG